MDVLMLIEAFFIIAAVLTFIITRFVSPSLNTSHPFAVDSSDNDDAVPISIPSSSCFSHDFDDAPLSIKHDVFLSFRGEDTRDNFTSHLYEALCRANIQTYIDNRLEKGKQISPILLRTIEESRISVIIFSKNYASSTWCLDELVKILECKGKYGRIVIPIFFNVHPSNIRKQRGSYGDAFINHEQRFKDNRGKVQRWKDALIKATDLSGWDSNNIRPESKLVKEIVKDILSKLNCASSCHFEGLVGIHHHIDKIEELLPEVHIVGILGMGGIGKTTLAKVLFHKLKAQFEASFFVDSVREQLEKVGLDQLKRKCLSELLEDKDLDTHNISSTSVKNRLQRKKVLLVLDDMDNSIQGEDLVKLYGWFGKESRIIITSRDKQVFKNATLYVEACKAYYVEGMNSHNALQLFSLRAFKQNEPPRNYVELSNWVVGYCQGNPLALIILGCFLCGRRKQEWESALEKLKQAPHKDIFNVLKLSFDGLDDKEKNIFLDIACFFSINKFHMEHIEWYYDSSAYIELSILKDKFLISVNIFGYYVMHDLLKEMGQEIASQQYVNNPGKLIRLSKHENIYHFLKSRKGAETVQGISLDMCKIKQAHLKANVFQKMYNMRFLRFYKSDPKEPSKVYISEGLDILPEELRLFHWIDYPLPYVPLSICASNLVKLVMHNSYLLQLWDEYQHFPNLKVIDLRGSELLIGPLHLSQAPNIKEIMLDDCVNLLQINSSKSLIALEYLSLNGCQKLMSVEILNHYCDELGLLNWNHCPLQSLPLTYYLWNLVHLSMCDSKLEQLWDEEQHFPHLKVINLRGSKYLIQMPDLSQTPNIQQVYLKDCTSLLQLYSSSFLFKLHILNLDGCRNLMNVNLCWKHFCLMHFPPSITCPQVHSNLEYLSMANSKVEKLWDENQLFPKLRSIDVRGCRHLNKLPNLSQTPNIESIYLDDCINLVQIHSSSILRKLSNLSFSRCNKLRSINLAGSIHPRSLKLLIACNYFDFKKLRFRRVTFRFLLSEGGNIYSLRLKVVSVPFTNMRLSSLLPFVGKLRCLNVTTSSSRFEFGSFCKCFTFDHGIHPVHFSPWEAISLELMRTPQTCEVKSSTRKGFMRGSATREEEIGGMKLMDPENSAQLDCDCVIDSMSKLPNSITRWSLLTNLSLQESDMVSVLGNEYLPGLPSLKSLAQSDCSSLQPIMDLTFSVNAKTSIFAIIFSEELNQSESSDALVTNIGDFCTFYKNTCMEGCWCGQIMMMTSDEVLNRPERSD